MKNKAHRDLPWKPTCWVGGRHHINLQNLDDDTFEKYAAVKTNAAILKAMRK